LRIETPGTHRLSIWMREDGAVVDKILLATKGDYKPSEKLDKFNAPTGKEPPESPQRSSP